MLDVSQRDVHGAGQMLLLVLFVRQDFDHIGSGGLKSLESIAFDGSGHGVK
jgi:hypothetical protein